MTAAPWLAAPIAQLDAMFERLPHGLLIQGPGGWGEELVAAALVRRLLSLDGDRAPREVAHPDLRWVEPDGGALKVEQIRETIAFLHQTPRFAGRKVAVLVGADRMNVFAGNALLKSLEEPPENSFVVLVASAPERLLATVKSRCQRLDLPRASDAEALAWLVENGAEAGRAERLLVEHGGAPFAVREALERGDAPLADALVAVGRDPGAALAAADDRREDNLADLAARWLRIVHRLARQYASQKDRARPLLDFADELQKLREIALANTGLNRTLHVQRLFLRWAELWAAVRLELEAIPGA